MFPPLYPMGCLSLLAPRGSHLHERELPVYPLSFANPSVTQLSNQSLVDYFDWLLTSYSSLWFIVFPQRLPAHHGIGGRLCPGDLYLSPRGPWDGLRTGEVCEKMLSGHFPLASQSSWEANQRPSSFPASDEVWDLVPTLRAQLQASNWLARLGDDFSATELPVIHVVTWSLCETEDTRSWHLHPLLFLLST